MLSKIDLVRLSSSALISLTPIFSRSSFQVSFSTSMFTAVQQVYIPVTHVHVPEVSDGTDMVWELTQLREHYQRGFLREI